MASPENYTVGWICAIRTEYVAAQAFLDETHDRPEYVSTNDNNDYTLGRIGKHDVVIAVLPHGEYGISSAATVARDMLHSFPNVRIGLMVGIGGGAPRLPNHDIRLGDVVVGTNVKGKASVLQYDYGKSRQGQDFEMTGFLNQTPEILRAAVNGLEAQYELEGNQFEEKVNNALEKRPRIRKRYKRPDQDTDQLYQSEVVHPSDHDGTCSSVCPTDPSAFVPRHQRTEDEDNPAIHYGRIASANTLMKDALLRDRLAAAENVLCFEMEAAGLMNHFPCLVIRGICDYSDSHKNKEWQGYAAMSAAAYAKDLLYRIAPNKVEAEKRIQDLLQNVRDDVSDAKVTVNQIKSKLKRDEDDKIINWLSKLRSHQKQQEVLSQHERGTGDFLLKSQDFQNWLHGEDKVLWCIGPPGAGKTVLAAMVIDTISKSLDFPGVGAAFLFCSYAERNDQTIDQLLGSLIQQLLLLQGVVPEKLKELYHTHSSRNTRPSLIELSEHLHSTLRCFSKAYIVIDGLDECDDTNKTRSSLLARMRDLDDHVRLLLTSRPLSEVYPDAHQFEVVAQEDDMRKYLRTQIEHEPRLVILCASTRGLKDEIIEKIVSKAGGMFLLAKLHLQSIATKLRLGTIRKALQTLPSTTSETYDDSMKRIQQGQERERAELAMRILMLVSCGLRPLSLGEIQHALLTMEAEESEAGIDRNDVYDKDLLIGVCAGIVTMDTATSTLRLIHHSAETYFENNHERLFNNAHAELTDMCIRYLLFDEFSPGPCPTRLDFDRRLVLNKLYPYACFHWGYHADRAVPLCQSVMQFLDCGANMQASVQVVTELRNSTSVSLTSYYGDLRFRNEMTKLHLVARLGVEKAVRALLEKGVLVNQQGPTGRTALSWASEAGNGAIVRLLLAVPDVDVNLGDEHNKSPLSWASEAGNDAIVKLLLAVPDVDVNLGDEYSKSPLSWAATKGHEGIVELLIAAKRINIDQGDFEGNTPLSNAARGGHEGVIRLLLASGKVSVDSKNMHDSTPLQRAAMGGHESIVRLLVETGKVNVNSTNASGHTPFSLAAKFGWESIVKFFLGTGKVNVDSKDTYNSTPLAHAAEEGHESIVRLLLATGEVNVNSRDRFGYTPFLRAVQLGQEGVIRLLLSEEKTDVNARCSSTGDTAILVAARDGYEGVLRLLLTNENIDTESSDIAGDTPLLLAIQRGHTELVKLLLATGKVDVNRKGPRGQTPAELASSKRDMAILELLRQHGATD